ncbi:MAG: hypothetical protein KBB26_10405 [Candidatus Omnitrophica bacterium]|nr:hypothetical protein [Candidatus Omnitrophota bacterium]
MIQGGVIKDAVVDDGRVVRVPSPDEFIRGLRGRTIADVFRRGKALVARLPPGGVFLWPPG